jgi:hypothetical protein
VASGTTTSRSTYEPAGVRALCQVVAQGAGSDIIKAALGDGKLAEYFSREQDLVDFEPIGFVVKTLEDEMATMSESYEYQTVRIGK